MAEDRRGVSPPKSLPDPNEIDPLEAEGSHQGIGHRAAKAPSDLEHGKKTRQRSKDIISGRS